MYFFFASFIALIVDKSSSTSPKNTKSVLSVFNVKCFCFSSFESFAYT
nr:MAG TPA: hypothetical protein [Caudoviricetes sp.]